MGWSNIHTPNTYHVSIPAKHFYCVVSPTNRYIFITTEKNVLFIFMVFLQRMQEHHRNLHEIFIIITCAMHLLLFCFILATRLESALCRPHVPLWLTCLPHILLVFTSSGYFHVIYWLINGSTIGRVVSR